MLEAAAAVPGHRLCLPKLVVHDERLELVITPVAQWEPHPDPACDLCIGRFTEWDAVCPFAGFGYGSALDDVVCVGYPADSIAALQSLDFAAALNRPRYVKGYISRGIDTDNDPAFGRPCFELSFGISPGMSGSPVWGHVPDPLSGNKPVRVLLGIAIATRFEETTTRRELVEERPDGTKVYERQITRNEIGVAVRLSGVLNWEIAMLGGQRLGELVPNDGTGKLPPALRGAPKTWDEVFGDGTG